MYLLEPQTIMARSSGTYSYVLTYAFGSSEQLGAAGPIRQEAYVEWCNLARSAFITVCSVIYPAQK